MIKAEVLVERGNHVVIDGERLRIPLGYTEGCFIAEVLFRGGITNRDNYTLAKALDSGRCTRGMLALDELIRKNLNYLGVSRN